MKYPVKNAALFFMAATVFGCSKPQNKSTTIANTYSIAFYNLENLFDTVDDPTIDDADFLPNGDLKWTPERYQKKLTNMASVIGKLGDSDGPELLGVCEIENRKVLEDLAAQPALKKYNYEIAHFNSPDARGIDVALLYKRGEFIVLEQNNVAVVLPDPNAKTRDILRVKGILNTDTITVLVNHWPSKRGGATESDEKRNAAATTARQLVDQEMQQNPRAKILLMGDFNDVPSSPAITGTLQATGNSNAEPQTELFNAFAQFAEQKKGSYNYRGNWDMIDQMMLSKNWLHGQKLKFVLNSATIYEEPRLKEAEGKYAGSPLRTYAGKKYLGGFSDHLPIFINVAVLK